MTLPRYSRQQSEVPERLPQTPSRFDNQTLQERCPNGNRLQSTCSNIESSAASYGALMLGLRPGVINHGGNNLVTFLWDEDTTVQTSSDFQQSIAVQTA
jgi:hypothetical protein